MDLAKLVDIEVALHRDETALHQGGESDLCARDLRIGQAVLAELGSTAASARARLGGDRALRAHLLSGWIGRLQAEGACDGALARRGLARAALAITLVLLLLGAGATRAALAYDGQQPVNVFVFLGVLVVPQIALLALLVWAMVRGQRGLLGAAISALAQARWLRGPAAATLGAVGARLRLHADAERWFVFQVAQRGAVAFNAGALATCLVLVTLTDLAFGWSTTLQFGPEQVHAACRWIAAPWAWFAADAVPSAQLVRDSQWVRMPGRFVAGGTLPAAVTLSGQWWSFLVAALAAWGLVPRLCAWGFAAWRARRAIAAVPFDDLRCQALFDRMLPVARGGNWEGPAPADIALPTDQRAGARREGPPPPAVAAGSTWVLCWGRMARAQDALGRHIARACGAPPLGMLSVGGADLAADAVAVRTLADAKAARALLVLAAGSQPTKDVLDLLRSLRQRLGPRARLGVALVAEDGAPGSALAAEELAGWRATLDREADPYLGLERLEASA